MSVVYINTVSSVHPVETNIYIQQKKHGGREPQTGGLLGNIYTHTVNTNPTNPLLVNCSKFKCKFQYHGDTRNGPLKRLVATT